MKANALESPLPLDNSDKESFYDNVYLELKPDATRADFEADWSEFVALKASHLKNKSLM